MHRIALVADISKMYRAIVRLDREIYTASKRALVSDIAKTYDVLGWFAPVIIKAKIMLQKTWESRVDWDELVPEEIA